MAAENFATIIMVPIFIDFIPLMITIVILEKLLSTRGTFTGEAVLKPSNMFLIFFSTVLVELNTLLYYISSYASHNWNNFWQFSLEHLHSKSITVFYIHCIWQYLSN